MSIDEMREHPGMITAVLVAAWQSQIGCIKDGVPFSTVICPDCAIDAAIEVLLQEKPENRKDLLDSFLELNERILNQIHPLPF